MKLHHSEMLTCRYSTSGTMPIGKFWSNLKLSCPHFKYLEKEFQVFF